MRPEKRSQRREIILKKAEEHFKKYGFNSTSMKQIAESTNLAVGTLYNYFKSKNDILLAIMEDELNSMITDFPEYSEKDSPSDIIIAYFKSVNEMFTKFEPQVWKEVFNAMLSSETHLSLGMALDMQLVEEISKIIIFFKKHGKIKPSVDPQSSAFLLYGTVLLSFMTCLIMPGLDFSEMDDMIRGHVSMLFEGLAAAEH